VDIRHRCLSIVLFMAACHLQATNCIGTVVNPINAYQLQVPRAAVSFH
jgi:hypothetical protein